MPCSSVTPLPTTTSLSVPSRMFEPDEVDVRLAPVNCASVDGLLSVADAPLYPAVNDAQGEPLVAQPDVRTELSSGSIMI